MQTMEFQVKLEFSDVIRESDDFFKINFKLNKKFSNKFLKYVYLL